jgi:hypothetical protein
VSRHSSAGRLAVVACYSVDMLQAHQEMCEEWHRWVLGRNTRHSEQFEEADQEDFESHLPEDIILDVNTEMRQLPKSFVELRPIQKTALETIMKAHDVRHKQSRTATAMVRTCLLVTGSMLLFNLCRLQRQQVQEKTFYRWQWHNC